VGCLGGGGFVVVNRGAFGGCFGGMWVVCRGFTGFDGVFTAFHLRGEGSEREWVTWQALSEGHPLREAADGDCADAAARGGHGDGAGALTRPLLTSSLNRVT